MEISIHNDLVVRAKTKKDGVYTYKGNYYLVINYHLHSYCDYFGNVSENFGSFIVSKGKAKDRFDGRDILKKYLKQLKTK